MINSSRKDHIGWVLDLDSSTDTWMFIDCVICGSVICGSDCVCTYYWLNGFDRVKVNQQNEISIRIDDNDGIIESWIQIRENKSKEIWDLMYTGGHGIFISLGAYIFNLKDLFDDFELKNEQTGEWQPFGVIDE